MRDGTHCKYAQTCAIKREVNYYAFGMMMPGRSYSSSAYRYGYNNQEKDDELKGNGNSYTFTARIYDSRTGRFLSVDPLFKEYPHNSPYAFAENDVIRAIDLEGLEKYIVNMRAFAPWKEFGGGYHGDNRGFTTAPNSNTVTSRVRYSATIDTEAKKIIDKAVISDPSGGNWFMIGPKGEKTATPTERTTNVSTKGNSQSFGASMSGTNPLFPGAPAIDWQGNFSFDKSNMDKGILSLTTTVRGDGFPAFETFVTDEAGNSVFLGGFGPGSKKELGNLTGNDTFLKITLNITVDKKGNFTGVKAGDKTYTLKEWNSFFEKQKPAGDCESNDCGN